MPATATQTNRHLAVATPLGDDKLLLRSVAVNEALGRPFQMELDLLSSDPAINLDDLMGHNVTVRLEMAKATRYFNGYVSRFSHSPTPGALATYRATVVPWLWFLTRTSDCRIFQQMTVPNIIKGVFRDRGFTDFEDRLSGSYPQLDYCVQYRETDFNFVSRLMEHEGIYYYFTHDDGHHKMVLSDSPASHDPYPGYESIKYRTETSAYRSTEEISTFSMGCEVQAGVFATNDFDFVTPKKKLLASNTAQRDYANGGFELYDFPGDYVDYDAGQRISRLRMEELSAQQETGHGGGTVRGLSAGFTFTLEEPPRDDFARKWLITSASIQASNNEFVTGGSSAETSCGFTAIRSEVPFRPARLTPKPAVQGPQTAIVVGKAGEEIWTDKYGRVKVQFHWDRYGKADENSSCWVRVAQAWAGKKWGAMYVPRIGQEVIVEFLEGDPDRPIITGRVYNGDAMPPYDLPGEATKSTLKSLSSKGGGGFNELRFEDKKGSEQVFLHAEKNQDVRVKNDTNEFVGNDRSLIVKHDQKERIEGDKNLTVNGDQNEKVDGTVSLNAGVDLQQKVGMKHAVDAGMEIHLKAGMNVVIEAGMTVTIKAGGGFIVVGPSGVAISGMPILINSGGSPTSGSGASPQSPDSPDEAEAGEGGQRDRAPEAPRPPKPTTFSAQAMMLKQAAQSGAPFCAAAGQDDGVAGGQGANPA